MTADNIKDTIKKTVEYVIKNGPSFEERLLKDAPEKFLFLKSSDEYHQLYQQQLREAQRLGDGRDGKLGLNGDNATTAAVDLNAGNNPQLLKPPPPFKFLTHLPPITPEDLEVIKLSALFVAVNGREYQEKLFQRGPRAQFEFLNPQHSLNGLYETYLKQYEIIVKTGNEELELSIPENSSTLINNAYNRAHYEKTHKSKQKQVRKSKKAKQLAYASIDWQDFAIIGSIKFDEIDEVKELAAPLKRSDLLYRTLESKQSQLLSNDGSEVKNPEKNGIGMVTKKQLVESNNNSSSAIAGMKKLVIESNNPPNNSPPAIAGMKIKAVGESRLKRKKQQSTESMVKCPITGKLIPESQFDDHLKELLRDPRYEEQRENYKRKNFGYESNITTDEVYENIKRITDKRAGMKRQKTIEK